MKQFLVCFALKYLRGSMAAKINRILILLVFWLLVHIPYLEHLCQVLQIPPEVMAGAFWAVLMEGLQWLRDKYPQDDPYLDPLMEGMRETGKPELADTVVKAEPVGENNGKDGTHGTNR